jgi:hypothetical protein
MHLSGTILSKTSDRISLEAQLTQAYVTLQLATHGEDHSRTATLDRHDAYEVRLVELLAASSASAFLFWIELFDHHRQVSIDSSGHVVLEDAVISAEHFIAQAKALGNDPGADAMQ